MKLLLFTSTAALLLLTGCYRMPSDECYSTVPLTNNPHVIPQKAPSLPGMSY